MFICLFLRLLWDGRGVAGRWCGVSSWCGGGVECGGGADMLFCCVVVVVLWCVFCVVFCLGGVCFARFFCGLLYESPGGNQVDGLPPVLHMTERARRA